MKKFRKRKIALSIISVLLVCSIGLLLYGNFYVDVQQIHVFTDKLPDSFHNYLIAHITDYHNRSSSLVDKQIIASLKAEQPDIIVITGDLIDCKTTDVEIALDFVSEISGIAPVYYVTGNHEANLSQNNQEAFETLLKGLTDLNVTLLRNNSVVIKNKAGDSFNLHGIDDPYFYGNYSQVFQRTEILCDDLNMNTDEFNVLLAHHPETLSVYYKYNIDLIFSGHAHGGQVTFFGKAIMAPDQIKFPPYTEGLYKMGNTQMILSRGIGYSFLPIRAFCNPHLIYAEFKTKE